MTPFVNESRIFMSQSARNFYTFLLTVWRFAAYQTSHA